MKLKVILIAMAVAILAGGCANDYKQLSISYCKIAQINEMGLSKGKFKTNVILEAAVDNPTKSEFEFCGLNAVLFDEDGTEFAIAGTCDTVTVRPVTKGVVTIPVEITLSNPLALLGGGGLNIEDKKADITFTAGQNGRYKVINWNKVPLNNLIERFTTKAK